jgi:hypothetical protein
MQLLSAETVAELPSASSRQCRSCGEKLELIRTVITETGKIIHMFECRCGERPWDD